jgi:Homeodomain-like domain
MNKRFLEDCLGKGMSLPQIGKLADRDPSTVGYWVKKHGLRANGTGKFAPQGGVVEEVLEIAVDEGMTLGEIAEELECSASTVRYWLKKYGLPTDSGLPRRSKRLADAIGTRKEMDCRRHGLTEFVMEGRGYYRCVRCRSEAVMRRRRRVKQLLVAEAGGHCVICGYDRCAAALEFHHLDPRQKSFHLSIRGITRGIDKLRAEAGKCALLCATCHAEVEAGVAELPLKLNAAAGDPK